MGHLPELFRDLALILLVGALVTILFKRIKQPLVLGYIIAGFFVGPYFKLFPSVIDTENIKTFSELGVIMLLFSLGLEFSFKKLIRVGGTASITAMVEIIFVGLGGYLTGYFLGWKQMDSLFLGGMLASSSTTIILRAFDELGVKTKQFASIVFGVLIVEDIIVILLMVLLSTIAVTQQFEGMEIAYTVLKLGFFLALWFILGIYLLPTFLKRTKKWMDDETLLILSIGLCLGMVLLATSVGFSAELGAFVMGSLIAETTLAEKVEHTIKPIKELFGTVFFVSVGMMIDPAYMVTYALPIFLVTLLTLGGKFFFSALGAILSGQPLKQSIQVGMSMAQIGEFAFIVATLGLSLGVISDFLFPIAVGVSAITTFTTPYMIKYSEPFYNWLIKNLPKRWVDKINNHSYSNEKMQANPAWKVLIMEYLKIIIINAIMLVAIVVLFKFVVLPAIPGIMPGFKYANGAVLAITMLLSVPFLWAIFTKQPNSKEYQEITQGKTGSSSPLFSVDVLRKIIGIVLTGFVIDQIASTKWAILAALPVTLLFIYFFSRKIQSTYKHIEEQFMSNFYAREIAHEKKNKVSQNLQAKNAELKKNLESWDAHIVELEVNPTAPYVGTYLKDLAWKEQYGINVVYIKRGDFIITLPGRNNRLLAFDKAGILATDDQLSVFKPVFDSVSTEQFGDTAIEDISLQQLLVEPESVYIGKTIKGSGVREDTASHVVGIERGSERMLNPDSSEILEEGDILWLVGNTKKIKTVKIQMHH